MSLSQPKIDLAVLFKLHQHAEEDDEAIPPCDVLRLFEIDLPLRRIELALKALEERGEVEKNYDHLYLDEGAWQISRDGLMRIDRALKVPASFVARLAQNGDHWLKSDEAERAVLKKLSDTEVVSQPTKTELSPEIRSAPSGKTDWTKWGTILTAISIVVAIILWKFS